MFQHDMVSSFGLCNSFSVAGYFGLLGVSQLLPVPALCSRVIERVSARA